MILPDMNLWLTLDLPWSPCYVVSSGSVREERRAIDANLVGFKEVKT